MKKILLIGGAGLIGRNILKKISKTKFETVLFDACKSYLDSKKKSFFFKNLVSDLNYKKFIIGDVRNKNLLKKSITEFDPDVVIHLGNLPLADYSNDYPEETISNILLGTLNLLELLKLRPTTRLIYASSSMIYGDFNYTPCDEKHKKEPKDVYGATKLATETLIKTYSKRYNIEYTIVRPSAVYGPGDINKRVVQLFIENAKNNKPITLHNKGLSELDFTYVEDIAEGFNLILKNLKKTKNQTFNITSGKSRSLNDLVNILKKYYPNLKINNSKKKLIRPKRGALDISKAKKILKYQPKFNLESGIKKYISNF